MEFWSCSKQSSNISKSVHQVSNQRQRISALRSYWKIWNWSWRHCLNERPWIHFTTRHWKCKAQFQDRNPNWHKQLESTPLCNILQENQCHWSLLKNIQNKTGHHLGNKDDPQRHKRRLWGSRTTYRPTNLWLGYLETATRQRRQIWIHLSHLHPKHRNIWVPVQPTTHCMPNSNAEKHFGHDKAL